MAGTILEISQFTKNFGGVAAVSNIDFEIYQNEIISLIGPNGAGKTTLFNCITGVLRPERGSALFGK
jgi:branched-chain amino acid transport system ATP-binding protein